MQIVKGDIWDYHKKGYNMVVPVNQVIKQDGSLVMGKGLACKVKQVYPNVPAKFALLMKANKMGVVYLRNERLIAFPTKKHWMQRSDIDLIAKSLLQLREWFLATQDNSNQIVLPAVGCGCGYLNWNDVKPMLENLLPEDNFTVVLRDEMYNL